MLKGEVPSRDQRRLALRALRALFSMTPRSCYGNKQGQVELYVLAYTNNNPNTNPNPNPNVHKT